MNVLIVEDDKLQRKNLKNMIEQIDKTINIYECEDKDEAVEITNMNNIDIFYIDISLKNSSGLDFAIELRKISRYEFSLIIFLTTHIEYLNQAFKEVHCYDYILKPYDIVDVMNMTKRYILNGNNIVEPKVDKRYVVFDVRKGITVKVFVDEIIFIEVALRVCLLHTLNGVYKINKLALKNIIKLINCTNIIQCHKSFAVNINHIREINHIDSKLSEIHFENYDKTALLGYKFKNTIMEKFQ
ncbi:LytTR family DNA-binding domain-containing protein [Clostridium estertheticum]|uniref:LytR/AlgR family response regulator transcription factor n=1 Tax=Clostridium estertheticum TaxID=238834 RepID=UPI0013E983CD|nr:LytTR family DNA-binding domain-containing protein [Clostridium estertheticum]MBZ9685396.1 LytTR family DNA-binding domain-containing protein [Clostridium estertheticum]